MAAPISKYCGKCDTDKWRDDFYRNAANPDGLQRYCKDCWGPYTKTNRATYRAKHSRKDRTDAAEPRLV